MARHRASRVRGESLARDPAAYLVSWTIQRICRYAGTTVEMQCQCRDRGRALESSTGECVLVSGPTLLAGLPVEREGRSGDNPHLSPNISTCFCLYLCISLLASLHISPHVYVSVPWHLGTSLSLCVCASVPPYLCISLAACDSSTSLSPSLGVPPSYLCVCCSLHTSPSIFTSNHALHHLPCATPLTTSLVVRDPSAEKPHQTRL